MRSLTEKDWSVMGTAAAYISRGEFEKALAVITSIEPNTTNPSDLATISLNKAQCCRMLRKLDAAHTECDRALDLSKGNDEYTVNAWIVKTTILIDEGRTADALTVIEASLRRYPNVNRNLQLLRKGELVASEGRYADAIAILRPLLQTKGFDKSEVAIIHHSLGVSHGALGQWDAAGSHLLKAESLDVPEGYRATNRFWLAHAAAKRGDFRSAKSHLLNALSLAGHSNVDLLRDLYESLSNVSRELGDKADAAMYGSMWEALPLKPK